jgi:hypothetical protein
MLRRDISPSLLPAAFFFLRRRWQSPKLIDVWLPLCARKPKALITEGRIFCDKRENENRSQAKNINKQEPSNIRKLEGRHNISATRQKKSSCANRKQ